MKAKLLALVLVASIGATGFTPSLVRVPADPTVYVTKSGDKYHESGCRYLRKSKIAKKLSEVKNKYSPCSVCKPPR